MKKLSFILALFFMTFGVSAQVDSPLTLEAIESGIITFTNKAWFPVSYCIDGGATQTIDAEQQKEIVVSSGQKVTFFGDKWGHLTGKISALNNDKYHILKQRNWRCDIEPARRELGYNPKYTLEEGVPLTIKWYQDNGWL